ncbi:Trk-type K+ transport system, membrane component [Saccharomonospora azurea SZMC 14600]|uniref:TrkH family potassium uptake protein n=1 Tax=Saccharomonospora azurea TaxID=40988 RepID=UPI00023FF3E6|nr:potassium transporter TrkG [Saccharomonospora azurea]EHK83089.1 Trk-type K+ transport system, membrane component [Saccharomonospora azurea SZMC 14600]
MVRQARRPLRASSGLRYPARVVAVSFAAAVAVGTVLLMLPVSVEPGESPDLVTAVFTSTSAVCVTGLIVVDTPGHWSTFGEVVIIGLVQVGGLGIMTVASLLGLLITRRLGLRMRLTAQTETKALDLGDVRRVVTGVALVSVAFEAVIATVLTIRFVTGYDYQLGAAVYYGVFHAVSALNNAGFVLFPDSLMGFVTDAWICVPIAVAVIAGGLGFPVWIEVWRHARGSRRRWSLHVKLTVLTTAVLLVLGVVAITAAEWTNPDTLGRLGLEGRLLAGFFHGVMPRTAGFNSLDVGEFEPGTLVVNDILMFIGGGSASTAGGIKVTTFALLAFVVLAEVRAHPTVHVLGRKVPSMAQRQALAVVLLSAGAVVVATLTLLALTPFSLDATLFEVVSAFSTAGLSTGITPELPAAGQLVLTVLMFLGRIGPITLASALALRERTRRYELPEERPIVG